MSGAGRDGLEDLYGEIILDHNRRPRNFGRLAAPSHSAVGHNPLCGDRVAVDLRLEDGRIAEIAFDGVGCAISTASASMMTEVLRGRTVPEARRLFERFRALVTTAPEPAAARAGGERHDPAPGAPAAEPPEPDLAELRALGGVREFPMRVKCATLAWHALQSALDSPARPGGEREPQPPGSGLRAAGSDQQAPDSGSQAPGAEPGSPAASDRKET